MIHSSLLEYRDGDMRPCHDKILEVIAAQRAAESINQGRITLEQLRGAILKTYFPPGNYLIGNRDWDGSWSPSKSQDNLVSLVLGILESKPALEYLADEFLKIRREKHHVEKTDREEKQWAIFSGHLHEVIDKQFLAERIYSKVKQKVLEPKFQEGIKKPNNFTAERSQLNQICSYLIKIHKPTAKGAILFCIPYANYFEQLLNELIANFDEETFMEGLRISLNTIENAPDRSYYFPLFERKGWPVKGEEELLRFIETHPYDQSMIAARCFITVPKDNIKPVVENIGALIERGMAVKIGFWMCYMVINKYGSKYIKDYLGQHPDLIDIYEESMAEIVEEGWNLSSLLKGGSLSEKTCLDLTQKMKWFPNKREIASKILYRISENQGRYSGGPSALDKLYKQLERISGEEA
jgi:hypothetical protein